MENAKIKKSSNADVICNAYYIYFIKIQHEPIIRKWITNKKWVNITLKNS
jgi:hypothetical protein